MNDSLRELACCAMRRVLRLERRFPTSTTLNVQGIEARTGTGWPLAADIPDGTFIVWWNTTATAARLYYKDPANALHYTSFTT